jgi:hypothetical protein
MSACVKWAKEQVESFNVLLARQLSGTEPGGEVWTQCMATAKEHARMLAEEGLAFENLVGRDLAEGQTASSSSPVALGLD